MDTAHSLIHDADLDECSEHEAEALGDSCLFDMIRLAVVSFFASHLFEYVGYLGLTFLVCLFPSLGKDEGPPN